MFYAKYMMNEHKIDITKRMEVLPLFMQALTTGFEPTHDIALKKSEYKTLLQIQIHEGESMSFYSEKAGLENGSYTYLATKLEKQGLIKRISSKEDKRKKIIVLTGKGRQLADDLLEQFTNQINTNIGALTQTERVKLEAAFIIIEETYIKLKEGLAHGNKDGNDDNKTKELMS